MGTRPSVQCSPNVALCQNGVTMRTYKVFLDDEFLLPDRYPGDDWILFSRASDAIWFLELNPGQVTHLSLDSDLGTGNAESEGPAVTAWLSEQWFLHRKDFWPTESCKIHSRNPNGRAKMQSDILNPRYNPRPEIFTPTLI